MSTKQKLDKVKIFQLILREWNCQFDKGDFAVWAAPALLKLQIEVSLYTQ